MKWLFWYILIVFPISWLFMGLAEISKTGDPSSSTSFGFLMLSMMMPAVGAVAASRFFDRENLPDMGLRPGKYSYYLIALFLPPVLSFVACILSVLLGQAQFDLSMSEVGGSVKELANRGPTFRFLIVPLVAMTANVLLTSIFTFGEELGWRGYLMIKLLPLGKTKAMAITGLIWGIWHAPIILKGYNYPQHHFLGAGLMVVFCVLFSFIFGWLRFASNSIFVPTLAHASLNGPAVTAMFFFKGYDTAIGTLLGVLGMTVTGAFVLWLWLSRRLNSKNLTSNTFFSQ